MNVTKEQLENAVAKSCSYSQVLEFLGLSKSGASISALRRRLIKFEISITHFKSSPNRDLRYKRLSPKEILSKNRIPRREEVKALRWALIKSGVAHECNKCKIKDWLGHQIILEINHIDGDWKNNTKENLEFLCPNCHSLTPNFFKVKKKYYCECGRIKTKNSKCCYKCGSKAGGVTRRKYDRPSKEELEKMIWSLPTIQIARKLGVSDKAIEKWCKNYGIEKPKRGYWQKIQSADSSGGLRQTTDNR